MSNNKRARRIALAMATLGCCLFLNDDLTFTGLQRPLVKQAHAYIGNPLTPMSYAGVARRTTRRTERREAYAYGPPGYGSSYGYPPPAGYAPPPAYPPPPGYPPRY